MAYQPLNTSRNEIRLLKILPLTPTHLITCSLFHVSLDSAPSFTAMSYPSDDDATATREILVDRHVRAVSAECWEVLNNHRSMRNFEKFPVWIDELCINPNDVQEREWHVLSRQLIYTKGEVSVCLGSWPDGESDVKFSEYIAVNAIHTLAELRHLRERYADSDEELDEEEEEERERALAGSYDYVARFLDRPWFSRMWTIQEFTLKLRQPFTHLLGKEIIPVSILQAACFELFDRCANLPTDQRRALLTGILRYLRLTSLDTLRYTTLSELALLQLLRIFRDNWAPDPRDKVYALLGMQHGEDGSTLVYDHQSLPIDYAAPLEDVYARTVKAIVLASSRLDVICACQQPTDFRRTWTPDWRQKWSRFSLSGTPAFPRLEYAVFDASPNMPAEVTFSPDLRTLRARGIRHSTVVRAGKKWSERSIEQVPSLAGELFELVGAKDDEAKTAYVESGEVDDASASLGYAMIAAFIHYMDGSDGTQPPLLFFPGSDPAWDEKVQKADFLNAHIIIMGQGRRTMRTSSGHFGCGPEELEVGDVVCVLLGCSFPVILRKVRGTNTHYTFVGECCVKELMQGQLVEALGREEVCSEVFNIR